MADERSGSSHESASYDYRDLAFYIKCELEEGTPEDRLPNLARLQPLPLDERLRLIERVKADARYTPRRQGRLADGCLVALAVGCFFIGVPTFIFLTWHKLIGPPVERAAINTALGPGTYESGVRVVDKHGKLSDGRRLTGAPHRLMIAAGVATFFVSTIVAMLIYYRIFGDRKDEGPSLNGYRLHLLLRGRPGDDRMPPTKTGAGP